MVQGPIQKTFTIIERFNSNEVRIEDPLGRRQRVVASIEQFRVGQSVLLENGIVRAATGNAPPMVFEG